MLAMESSGEDSNSNRSTDMFILCVTCEEYVSLTELQGHRRLHEALAVFGIKGMRVKFTERQLLKRRRHLIQEVQRTKGSSHNSPFSMTELEKINKAYEFLRFRLDSNVFTALERKGNPLGSTYENESTSNSGNIEFCIKMNCGQTVGVCQDMNASWRSAMEDSYIAKEICYLGSPIGCYGLFDGYNGPRAAEICSSSFVDIFQGYVERSCSADPPSSSVSRTNKDQDVELKRIIKQSFNSMDILLQEGRNERSRVRWSGCSACIALVTENTLYLANAGDIRGFIVKADGSFQRITSDHTPRRKYERHRIEKLNGNVIITSKTSLVNGLISSTRGLGNHGDKELKKSVINKPHISSLPIEEGDQFIALYTNGISQIFDEKEIMFLLEDILPESTEVNLLRTHYQQKTTMETRSASSVCKLDNTRELTDNTENVADTAGVTVGSRDDGTAYEGLPSPSISNEVELEEQSPRTSKLIEDSMSHYKAQEESLSHDQPDILERDNTIYTMNKATALALTMSKRLVSSALLAGSHENVSAMIILLKGCPIKLYLLPSKS